MFWAHGESFTAPYSLAQSGMPAPDPALLGALELDLAPPAAGALADLEERLAELFALDPERVLVAPGASGAMLLAALRWFPGALVVSETPSYEPFRALPELAGGRLALVHRRPESGWRLDLGEVERALATAEGPAHVFVCTPHNPTGTVLPAADLARLADLAARRGGVLISNEIYMEFAAPSERVHAFALAPNAVSIGSLTKAYGLGALRIGWILLGEGLRIERARLQDLAYLGWVDPPTPSLRAARAALDALPALLAPLRRLERESRPELVRWLTAEPAVDGELGPLGLAAFPRVHGVSDTRALARYLAAEHAVAVTPGEFFGSPGHVRVGWGVPRATLVEGLARLSEGLAAFRVGREGQEGTSGPAR
jgi:hypothetical protein